MKTRLLKLMTMAGLIAANNLSLKAQTISTFDNFLLANNSYWDGSAQPLGATFTSGHAIFPNFYDTSYGGFWSTGWAYSDMKDSTTSGFANQYSARTAQGYNNSATYAVGQQNTIVRLTGAAAGKVVNGFYVTNGTYPYLSMKDGDFVAKKFGGASGNDADWFKLTVRKWYNGTMTNDSAEFYLADYRFSNNAQDYIVKTWQWVDLSGLGNVDSLKFILTSSDNGSFGMNTPAFFCMDNFITADSPFAIQSINTENTSVEICPNPAGNIANIALSNLTDKNVQINVTDITGKFVYAEKINSADRLSLDVSNYNRGIYFINIIGENTFINRKLIKE